MTVVAMSLSNITVYLGTLMSTLGTTVVSVLFDYSVPTINATILSCWIIQILLSSKFKLCNACSVMIINCLKL